MDIGYFSYCNNEQRFSPTDSQECYKQFKNNLTGTERSTLNHNINDSYDEEELAVKEFDKRLAPTAQKIRSMFQSQKEIKTYLCNKYFGTDDVPESKKTQDPKTYAMYENDYNAVCFGTIGSANKNDPRLSYDSDEWREYTRTAKQDDKAELNNRMENLIKTDHIEMDDNDTVLISFDPYTYRADVKSDIDSKVVQALKYAINMGGNSKELFFYAYQNSPSGNASAVNKMRAYHSVFEFSGYKLSELSLRDGNFYTDDGKNIIDVIKKNINENELIPADFREDVLDNLQDSLDNIAQKGYGNIPDLALNVIYSKRDGFIMTGGNYSV